MNMADDIGLLLKIILLLLSCGMIGQVCGHGFAYGWNHKLFLELFLAVTLYGIFYRSVTIGRKERDNEI